MPNAWNFTAPTSECRTPGLWVGGLFELRLKVAEGIVRVFYCTLVGRRIVMLHQFIKKSEKTPRKALAIARKRMKEVNDAEQP